MGGHRQGVRGFKQRLNFLLGKNGLIVLPLLTNFHPVHIGAVILSNLLRGVGRRLLHHLRVRITDLVLIGGCARGGTGVIDLILAIGYFYIFFP